MANTSPNIKAVSDHITIEQLEEYIDHPPVYAIQAIVTPDVARHILENWNSGNRKPKPSVQALIAKHTYRFIGGILLFGTGRLLLDGQNRLYVCVSTNTPMRTFIGFGIDDRSFTYIDSGRKRTPGDAFEIANVKYAKVVADSVRWIYNHANGMNPWSRESHDSTTMYEYYRDSIRDKDQLERFASWSLKYHNSIPVSHLCAYLYIFWSMGKRSEVTKFRHDMESGRKRNKAAALVKTIRLARANKDSRPKDTTIIAWLIQAVNGDVPNWTATEDYKGYPTV